MIEYHKAMSLRELKSCIDKACEYAGDIDANVEVWIGKKAYSITRVGQFGIIPDVTITVGENIMDFTE